MLPPRSSAPAAGELGWIGVAHLELSDELLRAIDAAIVETGAGVDQAPAVPGHGRRDDGPASHYSQTRAFTRAEKRTALAPRTPVLRQRLTFLYREVSPDALQIPPLEVAIAP